jgi:hypothetical protein
MAENTYKFNVGDKATVIAMSQHQGLVGKIVKRTRQRARGVGWLTAMAGNIPPENIYYLVFEDGGKKYAFGENNLVSPASS